MTPLLEHPDRWRRMAGRARAGLCLFCGVPALGGHLTCGLSSCNERRARTAHGLLFRAGYLDLTQEDVDAAIAELEGLAPPGGAR